MYVQKFFVAGWWRCSMLLVCPAQAKKTPEMLLYCGITMVKPMTEIAHLFEQREKVKILIAQGGSEDLYQSAKRSGTGDWYLPGEPTYRDKHQKEGLLGDFVTVGYNQMALVVQKAIPKRSSLILRELLREDLTIILGNADSGSVGQESKDVLDAVWAFTPKWSRPAPFCHPTRAA